MPLFTQLLTGKTCEIFPVMVASQKRAAFPLAGQEFQGPVSKHLTFYKGQGDWHIVILFSSRMEADDSFGLSR